MPKISLRFKLPEEQEDFEYANKGSFYAAVIDELDNYLRGKLKYQQHSNEVHEIYQEIRDKLWELRNE